MKKFIFFCNIFKKWNFNIYSRFIKWKVKHFKSFLFLILMIRTYSSWKVKIQYLKLLEYFLRSIKQGLASSLKYVHFCTQYLVRAPLAQTPASVMCGVEAISRWLCWGTTEPSARLDCSIDSLSTFSWKYPIDSIWASCQACWLANQAQ